MEVFRSHPSSIYLTIVFAQLILQIMIAVALISIARSLRQKKGK